MRCAKQLVMLVVAVAVLVTSPCSSSDDVQGLTESVKVNILLEVLENQFLRSPIAVVLDLMPDNVRNFKTLWTETADQNLPDRDIVLIPVGEKDVGVPILYDTDRLSSVLAALQPTENASVEDDAPAGPVLSGVLSAINKLPYDSATLVVAGATPRDRSFGGSVAEMLIRKRARLYVVWTGEPQTGEDVLKETALLTGGAFFYMATNTVVRTRMQRLESAVLDQTILERKEVEGRLESTFSLNTDDTLRIQINGNVTQARLIDPQGTSRNLLSEDNSRELDLPISTKGVPPGVWLLVTNGAPEETYDINLFKEEWAGNGTEETTENFITTDSNKAYDYYEFEEGARIRRSNEEFERAQLRFPEVQTNQTLKAIGAANQQRAITPISIPVKVELASGSSLEVRPGTTAQIQYEVVNNVNTPNVFSFYATGSGLVINNVQPQTAQLGPLGSINVQVSYTPFNQQVGQGKVTFTANGAGRQTTRDAMIYIGTTITKDTWSPELTYKYTGDCSQFKDPANCDSGVWGIEATAKDEDSGLLRVMSEPYGLIFQSVFVAGTKSPVTVNYETTCCRPKVDIWAEDLRGNYNKKSIDVLHQGLQDGEIAAIVVGVILLIIIIVLIIVVVLYCRKRKSDRIVLPRQGR